MAFYRGPRIVTSGLVLALDAANPKSYAYGSTLWNDLSGNNNVNSLVNAPALNNDGAGSLVFDGSTNYASSSLSLANNPFTIICWVYPKTTPSSNTFFSVGSASQNRQAIHLRLVNNTSFLFGMYNDDLPVTTFPVTGRWNCFAVTLTSGFVQSAYQNGVLLGSRTAVGYYTGTNICNIGRFGLSAGEYFNGSISNIQVYNRALSALEVQQNYNAMQSRFQYPLANISTYLTLTQAAGLSIYDNTIENTTYLARYSSYASASAFALVNEPII
jgi:hypothetical protein